MIVAGARVARRELETSLENGVCLFHDAAPLQHVSEHAQRDHVCRVRAEPAAQYFLRVRQAVLP